MNHPKERFADLARRSFLPRDARSRWTNLVVTLALVGTVGFGGCGGKADTSTQSGMQPGTHSVDLVWDPSISSVVGYNVFRGAQSGGPYTKLNSTPVPVALFTDNAVQAGKTYFYVTTAVDANNVESMFSNEVSAAIPTP